MTDRLEYSKMDLVKKIMLFTIPIMLQGLLQSLYNAADLIVVGQFAGDAASASVTSSSPLTSPVMYGITGISSYEV